MRAWAGWATRSSAGEASMRSEPTRSAAARLRRLDPGPPRPSAIGTQVRDWVDCGDAPPPDPFVGRHRRRALLVDGARRRATVVGPARAGAVRLGCRRARRRLAPVNANGVCFLLSNCSVRFGSQCPTTENDHGKSEIADSCWSLRIKLKRTIPIRAGRPLAKVSDAFHKNFGRPVAGLNFEATLQFLFR